MQQLARSSQESIGLVVAVNNQVMCLEMITAGTRCGLVRKGPGGAAESGRIGEITAGVHGRRARTEALDSMFDDDTAGRATIEAELEQIRAQGYAVSESEVDPGVWGVSAPIFHRNGRAAGSSASITLMAPSTRATGREKESIDVTITTACRAISEHMQTD